MALTPVPGAKVLTADQLSADMKIPIFAGPMSEIVSIGDLAEYIVSAEGNLSNTNITTVGAGTLTAAALVGGLITRSGSTAAYTDTTATAAQLLAALGSDTPVNSAWLVYIKNTVAFAQTIAGGTNVTLSGQTIIPPNSVGVFLLTYSATTPAFTMRGVLISPLTTAPLEANTAISTVGAGTLTAAALVGGVITRTGPTGAYTDTTDTAANIVAALPNANVGQSWEVTIKNTVPYTATLAAAAGVTLSGQTLLPPNSVGRFLLTYSAAGAVTMQGLSVGPLTVPPLEVNTAISTVGAGTLTAAALVGAVITRSGSTAAYTDTTGTAVDIIAALPNANIGQSWEVTIKNTVPFAQTLAAGAGVTLSGQGIIPPNSAGRFLLTYSGAGAVTMVGLAMVPLTTGPLLVSTALSTVGAGTITAAGIAGGVTNRTGSVADFTDTTDTAANIIAARPNANIGESWEYTYYNNTLGTATITGGTGVNGAGSAGLVPATMWARYLVTYTAAATITMVQIAMGPCTALPASKYTAAGDATVVAGALTGANFVNYENTGNNATVTTRTATQMFGDIPNCKIGFSYQLAIRNTHATTLTLTAADASVTLTGTMTIAQNVTRMFNVVFTSAVACTITSMGISAAAA